MHRRRSAATAALLLLLLLSMGFTGGAGNPACDCAPEAGEPPPGPCEEPAEDQTAADPIPAPPASVAPEPTQECDDGAAPAVAAPEPSPPPLPPVQDVLAPAIPELPAAPAPIRAAASPGSTPTEVQPPIPAPEPAEAPDPGDATGPVEGRAAQPSLQSAQAPLAPPAFDGTAGAIAPSVAPAEQSLALSDAPEIALAERPVAASREPSLAGARPISVLQVEHAAGSDATARMLGGILVGFAVGAGLLLGGLQLHRRGGVLPPRHPGSPLHPDVAHSLKFPPERTTG